MKKEFIQKIKIPEEVDVEIDGNILKVKGKEGEDSREFRTDKLIFEKKGDEIIIGHKKATKKEKKMINTTMAHINNMIKGVQKKFEYKLKLCFNHFPFTVEIKGNEAKADIYEGFFFGPASEREGFKKLTGLALLDEFDIRQKGAQAQPRSLWRWKGRNAIKRYFANRGLNRDYIKEFYDI